jgi:outer membrane receptor protein involved in Fe transport
MGFTLMAPSLAFSAEAKSTEAKSAEEDDELAEVTVTGTRIQVSGNNTSTNPITSITGEEMRQLGIVNVADALQQLVPQNISTYMPTLVGDDQAGRGGAGMEGIDRSSFFIGNTIANLRGLDPTFGSRTLTMIDGRRVPSTSSQADVVDLNIIPSNLLQRMDVVTGGASATYGSGAMAGVVNLVLNNRLTGFNLDMDYGVNEAGDGGSPHVSASGGMPLFSGRGHFLVGAEWQNSSAILNCAAAREWCAESRAMATNSTGLGQDPAATFTPLPGYGDLNNNGIIDDFPARFQMYNVRRSQFAPTGTLFFNNANVTSNLMFNTAGTDLEEYALGFRGGTGSNAINGDGPLATWLTAMRPESERKSLFLNFEFNFTERTTGYVQANYARTDSLNKNAYTTGNYCVRFQNAGIAAQLGGTAQQGVPLVYATGAPNTLWDYQGATNPATPIAVDPRNTLWTNANFRQWLGFTANNVPQGTFGTAGSAGPPYWVSAAQMPTYGTSPGSSQAPNITFVNATAVWRHVRFNTSSAPPNATSTASEYWWLMAVIPTSDFTDPGRAPELPGIGANSYAFLNALTPEAQFQLQRAFGAGGNHGAIIDQETSALLTGASNTAGGGAGLDTIYGGTPCEGFTAVRKVWNPQFDRWTTQVQEPWRAVVGLRGRFGRDWRWEAYYQHGATDSVSRQNNVATTFRLAYATDAVIDNRPFLADGITPNPTYNHPVCRVTRDGIPVVDAQGRPLTDLDGLRALAYGADGVPGGADGCKPINLFGNSYANTSTAFGPGYDPALTQQQAIDYAFVESVSSGFNSLQTLSLTTNGTLWQGYGAGPLTGAFGLEVRQDKVDNTGTQSAASIYERADLASAWSDGFGGKTRVTEAYTELNMPLVSGQPGVNLWSLNVAGRYGSYHNEGGAGTTGQSATQNIMNWKVATVFEPFDWVRLRLTRSRDLRTAGYRDLFIQQPGLPDQFAGENPWREYNPLSDEARQERFGQVQVGNPDLKPESSNTLTLGLVLSPGGWAQGMRISADYYNIRVKGGITTPFIGSTTANITSCWEHGDGITPNSDTPEGSPVPVNYQGIDLDFFDAALGRYPCREITFATNPDGSTNLRDIINYNSARPINGLPYQRRGLDLSWNYMFPLSRAIETLPGSMSLTVRATHVMESSGEQVNSSLGNTLQNCQAIGGRYDDFNCYIPRDLVGQIRSSTFIPGVSASPKWSGNFQVTYILGDLTTSLSARYTGAANLDNTWCDNDDCVNYKDDTGRYLTASVDNNRVDPYFNFSLNGSYNLKIADMKQFQVFGSINNLFDKTPPFTGGGISGASSQYHDIMGRAYRMGVRMKF